MRVIPFEQCAHLDYFVSFLGSIEMPQRVEYPAFSCIGFPKKQDMLLFVSDCMTRYEIKGVGEIKTKSGDVVYVPKGSQYSVECVADSKESCTFQINFLLFDRDFQPFVMGDGIRVFSSRNPILRSLFEKSIMLANDASASYASRKAVLLEILAVLCESENNSGMNEMIGKGVEYLLAHYHENPSVPELAAMCSVSNEYFRKLFKKQTGKSPVEFKNSLRMKKAEQYLMYSDMPIVEISERLSYATVSHFIKSFKEQFGCSPLAFRNHFKQN